MVARGRFELPSAGPKPTMGEPTVPPPPLDVDEVTSKFWEYCLVDERLTRRVAKDYKNTVKRFLKFSNGVVSHESVRAYLRSYLDRAPKTYNNQLCGLRAFICRFLKRPDIMEGIKKAHEPKDYDPKVPSKKQLKRSFNALTDDRERAIFLFYATTGLRCREVLNLNRYEDIDFRLRVVKSKHDTRTKKAGVTFYNEECEEYLLKYLDGRKDVNERLFSIGWRPLLRIWDKASEAAGMRITPQVLRIWFSTEMGELGVPDRYVDIFQGRAPRSVLAKHYTGKGLERLKRIYDKAGLKVLS